jgi:hypothetical protein
VALNHRHNQHQMEIVMKEKFQAPDFIQRFATRAFLALALTVLCSAGLLPRAHAGMVNGSFEQPDISGMCVGGGNPPCYALVNDTLVPGWKTTATDHLIEIWRQNFNGVPAYDGNQHVELNATQVSTLYQDVTGLGSGSIVGFQFAHRGRLGVDTMEFKLTDLGSDGMLGGGDDTVLFDQQYSDGNTAWGFYTGSGIVALGNTVRFSFVSVSAAGGDQAIGNFLDDTDFGVGVGQAPEPASLTLVASTAVAAAGLLRRKLVR